MKYWKDNEIEYMTCEEGGRTSPYKHPASKVTKILSTGETVLVENEIVPHTSEVRDFVSYKTFEKVSGMCVQVECRHWRADGRYTEGVIWVPLENLGYKEEPCNSKSFDEAMKII